MKVWLACLMVVLLFEVTPTKSRRTTKSRRIKSGSQTDVINLDYSLEEGELESQTGWRWTNLFAAVFVLAAVDLTDASLSPGPGPGPTWKTLLSAQHRIHDLENHSASQPVWPTSNNTYLLEDPVFHTKWGLNLKGKSDEFIKNKARDDLARLGAGMVFLTSPPLYHGGKVLMAAQEGHVREALLNSIPFALTTNAALSPKEALQAAPASSDTGGNPLLQKALDKIPQQIKDLPVLDAVNFLQGVGHTVDIVTKVVNPVAEVLAEMTTKDSRYRDEVLHQLRHAPQGAVEFLGSATKAAIERLQIENEKIAEGMADGAIQYHDDYYPDLE